MQGIPSTCSVCGITGYKYGCPSYYDVCTDKVACRDRAINNERRKVEGLERRIKELEAAKA
jgi:hypothetical protein